MSAIAGILNLNGSPADPLTLERLSTAGAALGPDAAGAWLRGPVGLAHRALWLSDDAEEPQPLHDADRGLAVVLDGRVDDRDDLRRSCAAAGYSARTDGDAELVLRAYQAWGEECPTRLLGDYAFAIWDSPRQRLFCARDSSGSRPLFYALVGGTSFRFATAPSQLGADPAMPRTTDVLGIVDVLYSAGTCDPTRTPCGGVSRLPAAHSLVVDTGGIRVRRYWSLHEEVARNRSDPTTGVEACTEALQAAIRDRLRGRRVALSLSGGWDSGAIFLLWQWLRAREPALAAPWSYTFEWDDSEADETGEVRRLLHRWGGEGVTVPLAGLSLLRGLEQHVSATGLPEMAFGWAWIRRGAAAAHLAGARSGLRGEAGNEVLQSSLLRPADLLRARQARSAYVQLRAYAAEFERPITQALWPILMRPSLRSVNPSVWNWTRALRDSTGRGRLVYLSAAMRATPAGLERGRERQHHDQTRRVGLMLMDKLTSVEAWYSALPWFGAELEGLVQTTPYLDRRLVGLALVALEKTPVGPSRSLLGTILDRTVSDRPSGRYRNVTRFVDRSLRADAIHGNPLFEGRVLSELGVVDRTRLAGHAEAYRSGLHSESLPLWRLAATEAWARMWLRA